MYRLRTVIAVAALVTGIGISWVLARTVSAGGWPVDTCHPHCG